MFSRRESFKQYIQFYPITSILIAINVAVFLVMLLTGTSFSNETLYDFGAMFDLPGMQPEWWRNFTAMFLHAGFGHLFFNMFTIVIFAPPLEIMLGKVRYLLLYLISGVAGNLVSAWMHKLQSEYYIGVGASGAIYGLYAAFLFLAVFRKDIMDQATRQTILIIIVAGFVSSVITPRVDIYAHLGGFIGGFGSLALIVLSIKRRVRRRQEQMPPTNEY
ncbi:rhomboid family intramembrane serine protease [Paenibacillus sp. N1-5-1-14]|uniref:rhomboid family intramembrane serine protease n=1 Tax=Paenibacillus radicibacter TaxID=2972488 RepID=UPI002158C46E|nr:rhomboid family intramembrane serine protease [Paenibacillus radicibacter]MCR8642683.1 rhomboid family intramembrane serine protease [Paenibacillus radicibacter]